MTGFEHVEMLLNAEDRMRAGFTQSEIDQIQLQESQLRAVSGQRSAVS
jgi:hypothetical protein